MSGNPSDKSSLAIDHEWTVVEGQMGAPTKQIDILACVLHRPTEEDVRLVEGAGERQAERR